jgi:phage gpG-like protein
VVTFARNTHIRFIYGDLHIRITGLDDAIVYLDNLIRRSTNLSQPFQAFQKHWFASIQEVFASGGDPVPWPELSQAYANSAHGGDTTPTMRLSDRLYESLTSQTSDTIWQVGPRHIQFGSRVPYFEFHQEGRGNNPQRPTLTLTQEAAQKLVHLVEEFVMTGRAE